MKTNQIDMTEGSIFGKLLLFSIPLILSNVLQLFFNAADIVVVGHFAGDNALAAVGSTSVLINLLTNFFIGLSVGSNVIAANFFGAKEKNLIQDTVHTAIGIGIFSGLFLTGFGIIFSPLILKLMFLPPEVLPLSTLYLRIYFCGITFSMIYNFGSAVLRAKGDTKRPLIILFAAGFLNVLLNLLFVICFKMSVAGVAFATIISQGFSAVSVILILCTEKDDFKLSIKKIKIHREILLKIIKIGLPAGIQGTLFGLSNVVIQSSVNGFGAIMIAGNSSSQSVEGFVWTSMNGFAHGALTFCSQNMGAGNIKRIKKAVGVIQFMVIVTGLLLGLSAVFFSDRLISLFTTNPQVISAGKRRLAIICGTYFLCGMMDSMAYCIRGIGYSLVPMIVTLLGVCGLRLLWIYTVFRIPDFHTLSCVYFSYPITWFITWVALLCSYFIIIKKIGTSEVE